MLRLAEDAGLLHGYLENQLFSTAVQRGRDIVWRRAVPNSGPALSGARHRGAFRPARAVVLGRRAAGRRRALGHDVPFGRGGPLPADQAGRARNSLTLVSASATVSTLKWRRPGLCGAVAGAHRRRDRLCDAAGRGFRPRAADIARPRRQRGGDRGDHLLGLRRARACGSRSNCSVRSTRWSSTRSPPGSRCSCRAR